VDLGPFSGDTGGGSSEFSDHQEAYYKLQLSEDDLVTSIYLGLRIGLTSPPGADFDLFVYCGSCANPVAASSASTSSYDEVELRVEDTAELDTTEFVVHVKYWMAPICADWTLSITENIATDEAPACAP
jgi:hypothetical protein